MDTKQQNFDDIPEQALAWARAGRGVILATVVETWGSAPRPVGSQLAISDTGEMVGSVSGGCVEGAVVAEALEALTTSEMRQLSYGVSDEDAFAVGLACGGTISILIEPVSDKGLSVAQLDAICSARSQQRPIAYLIDVATGDRKITDSGETPHLAARFAADKSGFDGKVFALVHNPPLRLVVVGAVHIAQPLLVMARLAGFTPVLIDPREAFATPERFPGEMLIHEWPDEALADVKLSKRTAVVTQTHDPKLDDPAIETALNSDVFYLGCLGSTRTHAKRVARLKANGFDDDQIARIDAPVGLDIGSKTPAEIAVSIMAEIIRKLRCS